jgi:hypothetical protein
MESHPEIPDIWLNDQDTGITSAWRATRDAPAELRDLVVKFEPTVAAFTEYKQRLTSALSVPNELSAIAQTGFEKVALHRISYSSLGTPNRRIKMLDNITHDESLTHLAGLRHLILRLDPVIACNLRCGMCYFSKTSVLSTTP